MTDLRVYPGVTTVTRTTADGGWLPARATRDGALCVCDWRQLLVMEGRGFLVQIGTEDAPVNTTTSIDDELVWVVVDVPLGTTAIPISAEAAIAQWTTSALVNMLIEVDNGKVRYLSGGTAFTPLNLNTGSSLTSSCSCYVGTDVAATGKTAGGSLELYRVSIEDNWGDAGDTVPAFYWKPKVPPTIVGPASWLFHLGVGTADATAYGNMQWVEVPSTAIV